jgi:hypothetical protein
MALATMKSPFPTPGAPAPGTFDSTKIAQQMQTDPNVRTMFAQFFGDPASRQFVQDSGNITSALARPDNPWTPGTPMVATPSGPSAGAAPDPQARDLAQFSGSPGVGAPSSVASPGSGASLASRGGFDPASGDVPTSGVSDSPAGPAFAPNSFSSQGVATPGRPVAPMDNVHGARKALMLAFLGLNKFGAGLDHQQNSYADEFLGNELQTEQAQRAWDANQPLLRQQAINAQHAQNLGFEEKAAEIAHTGAETGFVQAQTGNLALNPPGKAEFLKELQDRRRLGADDPQALFNEYSSRAAYAHTSPADVANIINTTPENAPAFKIGPQGIREPITWHGQQWYGNEPNAPQQIKDAATAAGNVEGKVHQNKLQEQEASRSNLYVSSELAQKTKNLETGQKNAMDAVNTINDATTQKDLMGKLLSGQVDPAGQTAAMWKMIGLEQPEGTHRISPQEVSGLEQLGGISDRLKQKLLNWKQGDVFSSDLLPDIKKTADTLLAAKVKTANDQLQSNFETYGYKHPGTGAHGRLDEVQTPAATTTTPAAGAGTQQIQEGSTATGANGHKIKFTGGKWVDAATGQPI